MGCQKRRSTPYPLVRNVKINLAKSTWTVPPSSWIENRAVRIEICIIFYLFLVWTHVFMNEVRGDGSYVHPPPGPGGGCVAGNIFIYWIIEYFLKTYSKPTISDIHEYTRVDFINIASTVSSDVGEALALEYESQDPPDRGHLSPQPHPGYCAHPCITPSAVNGEPYHIEKFLALYKTLFLLLCMFINKHITESAQPTTHRCKTGQGPGRTLLHLYTKLIYFGRKEQSGWNITTTSSQVV